MKTMLVCGGFAACLPLLAMADGEIQEQLNGLQIETSSSAMTAQDNTGSGGPVTGNATLVLKLTNRDSQTVDCRVDPGPTATDTQEQKAQLAPGETATLRVDAHVGGQESDASLICNPASES